MRSSAWDDGAAEVVLDGVDQLLPHLARFILASTGGVLGVLAFLGFLGAPRLSLLAGFILTALSLLAGFILAAVPLLGGLILLAGLLLLTGLTFLVVLILAVVGFLVVVCPIPIFLPLGQEARRVGQVQGSRQHLARCPSTGQHLARFPGALGCLGLGQFDCPLLQRHQPRSS
jgi:hypothetical protein